MCYHLRDQISPLQANAVALFLHLLNCFVKLRKFSAEWNPVTGKFKFSFNHYNYFLLHFLTNWICSCVSSNNQPFVVKMAFWHNWRVWNAGSDQRLNNAPRVYLLNVLVAFLRKKWRINPSIMETSHYSSECSVYKSISILNVYYGWFASIIATRIENMKK